MIIKRLKFKLERILLCYNNQITKPDIIMTLNPLKVQIYPILLTKECFSVRDVFS